MPNASKQLWLAHHLLGLLLAISLAPQRLLDGKLIGSGAFGFANLEQKIPASNQTAFRIASMTKSFVALSIFKLRDDGKLHLDDPVSKYLAEFCKVQPPTADS